MKVRASFLAALAVALAATSGLAVSAAGAQPFGWAEGFRGGERGRGREAAPAPQYQPQYRSRAQDSEPPPYRGYAPAPRSYAPAPRAYAYPPPAYRYAQPRSVPQAYPYAQRAAPQAYAPPPAYGYTPPPPGRNSLGAYWSQQQDDARRGVREGNVPLGRVLSNIRRITPGRILDAGLEPGPDGRPAYRVRWAASGGRRIDYIVDAATGAIIGQSGY